jgi:hypothetical protein
MNRGALGFSVHTGWAAVVAVGATPDGAEVLAKTRIDVASTFDEGAVFHAAQELPIDTARARIVEAETRFTERARGGLAAFAARLGADIVAACVVAPVTSKAPPPLESILRSHALVHAAEGELYRRIFAAAGAALGVSATRVPVAMLAGRAAAALGLTPAALAARLTAMGKASGKPWAADQKQAALAAWLALAGPRS